MSSQSGFIKIQFGKEIHMYNTAGKSFQDMKKFIETKFHYIPSNYQIKAQDWENDWIIVNCFEDIKILTGNHSKIIKIHIEEIQQEKSIFLEIENFIENHFKKTPLIKNAIKEVLPEICYQVAEQLKCNVTHDVYCSNCQTQIIGPRYVCYVCDKLDYCQSCEAKSIHKHPFLKVKTPDQMNFVKRDLYNYCKLCSF